MKYIVVTFSSRTDSMSFYNIIKRHSGFCSVVNTPHIVSRACGISIKIPSANITIARNIISSGRFNAFMGIYEIAIVNHRETATKIY